MRINELILYRNVEHEELLKNMAFLMENSGNEYYNKADLKELLFGILNELITLADKCGFEGNLWQDFLTFLLVNSENSYSISCEKMGEIQGSLNEIAVHDFEIFRELFHYDFHSMESNLDVKINDFITSYSRASHTKTELDGRVSRQICELSRDLNLAESVSEFKRLVTEFYKKSGVGMLGLNKAFRMEHKENGVQIVPITQMAEMCLDDLVGYESAKQKLIENTEAFVNGRTANNCLLFGDAGTGKSSSIKAILNQYYDKGLRMIEIYKHQFQDLNEVIAQIKNRNYRFIIYMDDLSFEEFETEYKYLKAVIEGGLEKKPDNILIYATSNRRHLIRETFKDKAERDEDIHRNDTVQEKLSLADRFGVTIYFGKPDKKEFQKIVKVLAERAKIPMSEEELLLEANKWELSHGGLSGRTAQQFVDYLLGMMVD